MGLKRLEGISAKPCTLTGRDLAWGGFFEDLCA